MPNRPGHKPDVVFEVPPEVQKADQSGWVYRSDQTAPPQAAPPPGATPPPAAAAATAQARPGYGRPGQARPRQARPSQGGGSDWLTEVLAYPFLIPFCHLVSLLSSPRRHSSN